MSKFKNNFLEKFDKIKQPKNKVKLKKNKIKNESYLDNKLTLTLDDLNSENNYKENIYLEKDVNLALEDFNEEEFINEVSNTSSNLKNTKEDTFNEEISILEDNLQTKEENFETEEFNLQDLKSTITSNDNIVSKVTKEDKTEEVLNEDKEELNLIQESNKDDKEQIKLIQENSNKADKNDTTINSEETKLTQYALQEIDDDTLKAKKLIEEENMDVIEALDHLDKLDEQRDFVKESKHKRKIKAYLNKKLIPLCICFFITAMMAVSAILISMSTMTVSIIVDDDDPVTVKQIGSLTTADALSIAKITPSSTDTISKSLDANLKDNDVIKITTASKVLVTDGSEIVKVDTGLTNENEIVEQAGFEVTEGKSISSIEHDNTSVYAVLDENQKLVNKTEKVKYKTIYKEVDTLDGEDEKVVQKGQNGKINYISVVTTNAKGEVVKTKNLTKTVETKVQNKIVEVAKDSDDMILISENGGSAPVKYNQKMTVEVTAYCSCAKCCGVSTGITASGTRATAGRTIAAWSGLPFGTKVYFPALSGNSNGGVYVVEDRGGAISSGRIDIYFDSHSAALAFGRRTMEAYILK